MSGSGSSDIGYGIGGGQTDCNLEFETTLSSPNPAVVTRLFPGAVLAVEALDNPPRVVAIDGTDIAGGIANQAAELVRCIQQGNRYGATVQTVNGGAVRVRIARR